MPRQVSTYIKKKKKGRMEGREGGRKKEGGGGGGGGGRGRGRREKNNTETKNDGALGL